MAPRDWFSVGARLIGLYVVYRGSEYLLLVLMDAMWSTSDAHAVVMERKSHLLISTWYFVFGFILLLGAETITRIVFKEPSQTDEEIAGAGDAE